jgi:flagellar biosynthesis anti-sigma factor FlgM
LFVERNEIMMPDAINTSERNRLDVAAQDRLRKAQEAEDLKKTQSSNDSRARTEKLDDEVRLSNVAQKAMASRPDVDQEKGDRIKQAIEEGRYPVDSRRLAESFASLERLF